MPTNITDSTSGTQVFSGSSTGTNIGSQQASAPLSVNGHTVIANNTIASSSVTSGSIVRFVGSVNVPDNLTQVNISGGPTFAGFGSVSKGFFLGFSGNPRNTFSVASGTTNVTINYAVL